MRKKTYIGLLAIVLATSMIGCSKGNTDTSLDIMTSTDSEKISTDTDSEETADEDETTEDIVKDKKEGVSSESVSQNENSSTNTVMGNSGTNTATSSNGNNNGVTETVAGSHSQTQSTTSGNNSSNTQAPATPTPTAPEENISSGNGGSSAGGNSGSHAGQTWHSPEYEMIWIVDKAAWTEDIPQYETKCRIVCGGCGAYMYTQEEVTNHPCMAGYRDEYYNVQVGTTTIAHPEEGHWEEQLVKEGYWE